MLDQIYNSGISVDNLHRFVLLNPLTSLAKRGEISSPRGLKVLEVENFHYVMPPRVRFMNFVLRKLNLPYIKKEFLWYLRGDRHDLSIAKHAKMWQGLIQPDNGINSNYGQYIFSKDCDQFSAVVKTLTDDPDSRRAAMVILQPQHLLSPTSDVPCTYSLRFSIRNRRLNMAVHMRSQDAIFGMGNDLPCFSFIHEMMFVKMQAVYPYLVHGDYNHFADSFHVYERHFGTLSALTGEAVDGTRSTHDNSYTFVDCPRISSAAEVDFLINGNFTEIPPEYAFTLWLLS